jgi:hypothetical protein
MGKAATHYVLLTDHRVVCLRCLGPHADSPWRHATRAGAASLLGLWPSKPDQPPPPSHDHRPRMPRQLALRLERSKQQFQPGDLIVNEGSHRDSGRFVGRVISDLDGRSDTVESFRADQHYPPAWEEHYTVRRMLVEVVRVLHQGSGSERWEVGESHLMRIERCVACEGSQ